MTPSSRGTPQARRRRLCDDSAPDPVGRARTLRLLPSGDGWSLVTLDGELVYSALGLSGRRRCLEFAQAEVVLALVS